MWRWLCRRLRSGLRSCLRRWQIQRPLVPATLQQQAYNQHNADSTHFYTHKLDGRDYMTESEFNELADAVFARIEQAIDASGEDIECNLNGAVLELEFDDGSKVIINRHTPNREIWLAAKSGGFHYVWQDERWHSRRDGSELFGKLGELIQLGCGTAIKF